MQKILKVNCECKVAICDHAMQDVAEMLQNTYDDGYDAGWADAHETVRQFLLEHGVESVRNIPTPAPPERTKSKPRAERNYRNNKSEQVH